MQVPYYFIVDFEAMPITLLSQALEALKKTKKVQEHILCRAPNGSGRVGSTPYPTRSIGSGRVTGQNGSDGSLNLTNQ